MARKDPALPPLRNELVSDKINDMHFASDMIRRTVYTNPVPIGKAQQQESAGDSEIAARTSQRQMKGLQHSQSMQTIIHQVMEVHNTMTGATIINYCTILKTIQCFHQLHSESSNYCTSKLSRTLPDLPSF
jgi:hypothetical protein